eukprot:jgi/Tetstr1/462733/TSEL_007695.t1
MSSRASKNSAAASDWAARRKEAMERAARLKEERKAKAAGAGDSAAEAPPLPRRDASGYAHVRSTGYGAAGGTPPPAASYGGHAATSYGSAHYGAPPPQPPPQQHYAATGYHDQDGYGYQRASAQYGYYGDQPDRGRDDYGYAQPAPPTPPYHSADGGAPTPTYGRRSPQLYDAEHALDPMPALDLRPVRVRRPGSSSKIHSQGQPREPLSMHDDWSSPEKEPRQRSSGGYPGSSGGDGYGDFAYGRAAYSSSSYQAEGPSSRGGSGRRAAEAAGAKPGSRRAKPEWNSDFVEERPLGSEEASTEPLRGSAHVPRAGRRASPVAQQPRLPARPDWNGDFVEPADEGPPETAPGRGASGRAGAGAGAGAGGYLSSVQQRAEGVAERGSRPGSVRAAAGRGLEKLKKMSLRRAAAPSRAAGGFAAPAAGAPPEQPPEYADAPVALARCGGCGRSFNETALARHAKVCAKVFQEKRKPMDITQQRIGGTDAAKHYQGGPAEPKPSAIKQAALERKQKPAQRAPAQRPTGSGRASGSAGGGRPAAGGGRSHGYSASQYDDDYEEEPAWGGGGRVAQPRQPSGRAGQGGKAPPQWQDPDDAMPLSGSPGVDVCAKVFQAKRKPMDMTKQRVAGTEAAKFVGKAGGGGGGGGGRASARAAPAQRRAPARHEDQAIRTKESSKAKWRQQSEGLRAAMAANKQVAAVVKAGGKLADIPYVPSAPDPSLVPCPHCGRTYNQTAAERHIPKCASIIAKPKMLKRNAGYGAHNRVPASSRR